MFEAILVFDDKTEISARPSDSIALALRTGTPVFCTEEILAEAGIPVPDSETTAPTRWRRKKRSSGSASSSTR